MTKKAGNAAAAAAAETGTTDATEATNAPGTVTVNSTVDADKGSATPPADPAEPAAAYVVVWHVKAGGKLHAPGDTIAAELVTDAMLVPGGSVVKA